MHFSFFILGGADLRHDLGGYGVCAFHAEYPEDIVGGIAGEDTLRRCHDHSFQVGMEQQMYKMLYKICKEWELLS